MPPGGPARRDAPPSRRARRRRARGRRGADAAMWAIARDARDALATRRRRARRAPSWIIDSGESIDDDRARRASRVARQFAAREALAMDEELDEPFDLHELYAFLMMPADEVAKAFGMPSGSFRLQYVKAHVSLRRFIVFLSPARDFF